MKKFMQKIDSFAKRFFSEISEADVLPEYDINNPNLAGAEAISETMIGELKKAENDTMSLFSSSVDPNYKAKKETNVRKQNKVEKINEINHELEKNENIKRIDGKELDR